MRRIIAAAALLCVLTVTVQACANNPFCFGPFCRRQPAVAPAPQTPKPAPPLSQLGHMADELARLTAQVNNLQNRVESLQQQQITVTVTDRGQHVATHEHVANGSVLALSITPTTGDD